MAAAEVKVVETSIGHEQEVNDLLAQGWQIMSHSIVNREGKAAVVWVLIKLLSESEE
ncbi:MAG: hypothetical protein GTO63_23515 [Anaerolineae bacterium]|nr:hypothetical protein [Anaerolineae bacterium]NIN97699.1 hypothetical protein [Anaerolineae bacterium]NIQ80684.1 hypothetical protein [Anaerolineae bacterium]